MRSNYALFFLQQGTSSLIICNTKSVKLKRKRKGFPYNSFYNYIKVINSLEHAQFQSEMACLSAQLITKMSKCWYGLTSASFPLFLNKWVLPLLFNSVAILWILNPQSPLKRFSQCPGQEASVFHACLVRRFPIG